MSRTSLLAALAATTLSVTACGGGSPTGSDGNGNNNNGGGKPTPELPSSLVSPTVRFDISGGVVTGYGFTNVSGAEVVTCNPKATDGRRQVQFPTDNFISDSERDRAHMNDATATFPNDGETKAVLWLDGKAMTEITIPQSAASSLREGTVAGQIVGTAITAQKAVNGLANGMVPC